jgi:hypothetical protein
MKIMIFICLLFICSGCAIFQPEETNLIPPKLIKQTELPQLNVSYLNDSFEFDCYMVVTCCGDVEKVTLLTSSGDAEWDSLAEMSLMQWKYSPAIYDGHPVKLPVRNRIKVVFEEPKILPLAEIQLLNQKSADSVYTELLNGTDFALLAIKCSISQTKNLHGILGNVNIKHFSYDIRNALSNLEEGEFTKPLVFGDHFVIYKRLKLNN